MEHFTSTLQKAHDHAVTAERAREKGRKRPKTYVGNLVRTKEQCCQRGWELAAKGFHSVKAWLLSNSCETTACGTLEPGPMYLDLREESEESVSEDKIQPKRMGVTMSATILEEPEADSKSEPESGMMVGSDTLLAVRNSERLAPDSDFQVDPKEAEWLCCQDVVAQMLQDL